jgi:glutathione S-transferase
MKLYYAAGTCSFAAHIVAREAGIPLELEKVDIFKTPHVTASGRDFAQINPKGYVPALLLDDGSLLSEGAAIMQYLADLNPDAGLAPPAGTLDRYHLQSWLNFIAAELHKMYSPWLFHAEYGMAVQQIARDKIAQRLALVEDHLSTQGPFLMGEQFTAADAYLFTIVGWSSFAKVDLAPFPALRAFMQCVASRPKVREALAAERTKAAA